MRTCKAEENYKPFSREKVMMNDQGLQKEKAHGGKNQRKLLSSPHQATVCTRKKQGEKLSVMQNSLSLQRLFLYKNLLLYNNCVFCQWFLVCSSIENRPVKLQDREKGSLIREWQFCIPVEAKGCFNYRLSEWSPWASVVFALTATFIRTITSLFPVPGSLVDSSNCLNFFFSLCTASTPLYCHQLLYGTRFRFT